MLFITKKTQLESEKKLLKIMNENRNEVHHKIFDLYEQLEALCKHFKFKIVAPNIYEKGNYEVIDVEKKS